MSLHLGKKITDYPDLYTSESVTLLQSFPRSQQRCLLPLSDLLFHGVDWWNHYEMQWLDDATGWPKQAFLQLEIPAHSPNLIESKSLKLYLGSFSNSLLSESDLVSKITHDLSVKAGAPVQVKLETFGSDKFKSLAEMPQGIVDLGKLNCECSVYHYQPEFLNDGLVELRHSPKQQHFFFNAFRSNCLVTGQPDWAHIFISHMPNKIDLSPEALLRYLVSFRQHQEFHEHCIERIFCDLYSRLEPQDLTVYGAFFRRGSLDINPIRSLKPLTSVARWARQPYH